MAEVGSGPEICWEKVLSSRVLNYWLCVAALVHVQRCEVGQGLVHEGVQGPVHEGGQGPAHEGDQGPEVEGVETAARHPPWVIWPGARCAAFWENARAGRTHHRLC